MGSGFSAGKWPGGSGCVQTNKGPEAIQALKLPPGGCVGRSPLSGQRGGGLTAVPAQLGASGPAATGARGSGAIWGFLGFLGALWGSLSSRHRPQPRHGRHYGAPRMCRAPPPPSRRWQRPVLPPAGRRWYGPGRSS